MIHILIVDDSAVVRETLKTILSEDPEIGTIETAQDPVIAMKKMETSLPDVLLTDIEMPRMDGLSFLQKVMETNPIPVIICSSMAEDGSTNAVKALELGAVDIIQKPRVGTRQFLEESRITLYDAVHAAYATRKSLASRAEHKMTIEPKLTADAILEKGTVPVLETTERVVAIGASTGGTEALKVLLEKMPVDAPGMVVVQHMPENFTRSFAERLDSLCKVHVKEAQDGDSVLRGQVLIAPGNKHTLLKRSGARYFVEVRDGPLVTRHRPSVDVLFRSAARYAGKNTIGVILTGMGDDGARGMKELHDTGAYTIAQDEKTCVVFGMPAVAIEHGGVDSVLPLDAISADVISHANR